MSDGLVTIGTYSTVFEADMVKGQLEAFGVDAVFEDRNMVGVNVLLDQHAGRGQSPRARGPGGGGAPHSRSRRSEPGEDD